ncbi:hypothetical protein IBX73_11675 [candidate division WOR-3 bacterium]|nr:hypothetical protein [candidate division WOR-3 bacterium]
MAKILNWHSFRNRIKEKKLLIFTPYDVARIFGVSSVAANFFVFRNTKKGLLVRLKKSQKGSLYCLAEDVPDRFSIANRIYTPSYVSFDTALSFHNIIPETVYSITSATTKSTREFRIQGVLYIYHRIKRSAYTGYRPVNYASSTILMASPEKALADYLYFVALKKRALNYERLDLGKIAKLRLMKFVRIFDHAAMFDLVEQIYADFRRPARIR